MNLLDFFGTVLAQDTPGFRCIATPLKNGAYAQHFYADDAAAVHRAEVLAKQGKDVYFALGVFRDEGSRKGSNAVAYRSLWCDLDVGAGKAYASQRDAIQDIWRFVQATSLPKPLLVSSGYGVHAYWPLDADVDPVQWRGLAIAMRELMTAYGVGFDRTRATDLASVLRPPGTSNLKNPSSPKRVRVLTAGDNAIAPSALMALLKAATPAQSLNPGLAGAGPLQGVGHGNDELSGGMSYQDADASLIADECEHVRRLRDAEPNLSQPAWFHAMQVVQHCKDGVQTCHDWSAKDPRYTQSETDTKLQQLSATKPTLCQTFHDNVDPTICTACPHWGKVKSPMKLGYPKPVASSTINVERVDANGQRQVQVFQLPNGFTQITQDGHAILVASVLTDKKDGTYEDVPFCDVLFFPVQRVETRDGFFTVFEMRPEREAPRLFRIPTSTVSQGGAELHKALGQWEIVAKPGMKSKMESYLSAWQSKLRREVDLIRSYRTFGWVDEGFVHGRTLFTPNGPEDVTLVGQAEQMADHLVAKGDVNEWIDIIDQAYNRPGQEAYQFMVMCGFASPLFALYEEYGGVTVYAYSGDTGRGKTTAQRAALSIWGNWKKMQINEGMATGNAFFGHMAAYHNLPMVFDELTNIDPETASRYAFTVSQGQPKRTMTQNREMREIDEWSLIMLASGNTLLTEKIAGFRANADAEIARVFEFHVDAVSPLTPTEAASLFPRLTQHYGAAGEVYADYLARHREKLRHLLENARAAMAKLVGATQQERYWAALMGAVLLSHAVATKLGLVAFDRQGLIQWMTDTYFANRVSRASASQDNEDHLGRMLNDLWPAILVTEGEGHAQTYAMARVVVKPTRAPLAGRCILAPPRGPGNPGTANVREVLYLSHNEVRAWANKHGVSATEMFRKAVAGGWCAPQHRTVRLGKGTEEFANITAGVRCWELDMARVNADAGNPIAARVAQVTALRSGSKP